MRSLPTYLCVCVRGREIRVKEPDLIKAIVLVYEVWPQMTVRWSDGAIWGTGMSQDSLCVPPFTCKIIWNWKFFRLHVNLPIIPNLNDFAWHSLFFVCWKSVGSSVVLKSIDIHYIDKTVFKISDFVFRRRKSKNDDRRFIFGSSSPLYSTSGNPKRRWLCFFMGTHLEK